MAKSCFSFGLVATPGIFHLKTGLPISLTCSAVIGQQLLGAVQIVLGRNHQVLAPHLPQFAPMQLVAGDEIERLFEVGRDFVGDDTQVKAVRRIGLAGGQAGIERRQPPRPSVHLVESVALPLPPYESILIPLTGIGVAATAVRLNRKLPPRVD